MDPLIDHPVADAPQAEARPPAPRSKGRPSLEEAAGIDRAILDAALDVLFRQGKAATLNDVAQTAGLSRKSVYARFPGKTELFISAIRQSLQAAGPVQFEPGVTFPERLANYLIAVARMVSGPNAMRFHRLLSVNPDFLADLKAELLASSRKILHDPLVELLAEARDRGEIVVGDLDTVASIIALAAVSPRFSSGFNGEDWPTETALASHVQELTALLTRGLLIR